jgi:hypothetical protein
MRVTLLSATLVLVGCSASLDTSLDNKRCTADGRCLPGYACSLAGFCEPFDDARNGLEVPPLYASLDAGANGLDAGAVSTSVAPPKTDPAPQTQPASQTPPAPQTQPPVPIQTAPQTPPPAATPPQPKTMVPPAQDDAGGTSPCAAHQTLCGSVCVDLARDATRCGACDHACPAVANSKAACNQGVCAIMCNAGLTDCAGKCVDTMSDVANCNGCGLACASSPQGTALCTHAKCGLTCESTLAACGGQCVDIVSNAAHCGQCDKKCKRDEICSASQCMKSD